MYKHVKPITYNMIVNCHVNKSMSYSLKSPRRNLTQLSKETETVSLSLIKHATS